MITAKINDEGAQLYVVMKGSRDSVGKVEHSYRPHHIAVRCAHSQRSTLRKFFADLHKNGYWKEITRDKTTRLVHINLSDVRNVLKDVNALSESL